MKTRLLKGFLITAMLVFVAISSKAATTTVTNNTTGLTANGVLHYNQAAAVASFSIALGATGSTLNTITITTTAPSTVTNFLSFTVVTSGAVAYNTPTTLTPITSTTSVTGTTVLTLSGLSTTLSTTANYFYIIATYNVPGGGTPPAGNFTFKVASAATQTISGGVITTTNVTPTPTMQTFTLATTTAIWVGTVLTGGTDWNTAANWSAGVIPGPYDVANIGVANGYNVTPVVSANTLIGSIVIGDAGTASPGITVNSGATLAVTGDVTLQSNNVSANTVHTDFFNTTTGTGTITAANLNIIANTAIANAYTELLSSSVTNLSVTNIALTNSSTSGVLHSATFNLSGGTATVSGELQSTNVAGPKSTFEVTNSGTILQLSGTTPLSGLSTTGTNVVDFSETGTTVSYNGASQTVYTYPITAVTNTAGAATAPQYYNLTITTTGTTATTKTFSTGTLAVSNNFELTSTQTLTADLSSNTVTSNIGNFSANANVTLDQGGTSNHNFTVTGTATNAGTLNLTGNSSFAFNGTTGLNNSGTLNGNSALTTAQNILIPNGTFTNSGTINWYGASSGSSIVVGTLGTNNIPVINSGFIFLGGGGTTGSGWLFASGLITNTGHINLTNTGVIDAADGLTNNNSLSQSNGNVQVSGALLTNAGTITKTGGTLDAQAGFTNSAGAKYIGSTGAGSITEVTGGTFTNSGTLTCNNEAITFDGDYKGLSGSTFTAGTGMVYFDGSAAQALSDASTAGTVFNNVTFEGAGTANMGAGSGNFSVSGTGLLSMGSGAKLVAGTSTGTLTPYLTLLSNASGSAGVGVIQSGSSITGYVNVQRYLTGTNSTYRGYRILSSQVNSTSASAGASNYINLYYLNKSNTIGGVSTNGIFTGGPGTGFSTGGNGISNPAIYLYKESNLTSNTSFISGKYVGIDAISTSAATTGVTTVSSASGTTVVSSALSVNIPAGNGYLVYFVGDNTLTSGGSAAIKSATITNIGYINQSGITVNLWYTPSKGASTLSFTTATPPAVADTYQGYNLIGNPYPCSLNLNTLYSENSSNNIGQNFYELNNIAPNSNFLSWNGSTGMSSSSTGVSPGLQYIASGQGFFVTAKANTSKLVFNEDQKYTTPLTTIILKEKTPDAIVNVEKSSGNILTGLHLRMQRDSLSYDECGIYFSSSCSDNFDDTDAREFAGANPAVYLSSYTADNVSTSINAFNNYTQNGKRVKLYVKGVTDGLYNMKLMDIANIDTDNYNVFLIDKYKSDSLDMVRYKSYAFNVLNADTNSYGANRFVLAIERRALPAYALVNFTGQKTNPGIQLNWTTYNEGNFTGFVLQKLNSSGKYVALDSLQSTGVSNYSYTDINPVTGNNIYRLQQNDINGKITYSAAVNIIYGISPGSDFMIYPNPSRAVITINTGTLSATNSTPNFIYSIYNTSGTLVGQKTANSTTWTEDLSNYKAGMYIIILKDSNGNLVGKSKFIKTN